MVRSDEKFRVSTNQVSSNLAGSTVILNHKDGLYYELNEVGTFIWDLLKSEGATIEDLKTAVLNEFEINEEKAKSDIDCILNDLKNEKLVEIL